MVAISFGLQLGHSTVTWNWNKFLGVYLHKYENILHVGSTKGQIQEPLK